jgi:penicillin-binding protein 1A
MRYKRYRSGARKPRAEKKKRSKRRARRRLLKVQTFIVFILLCTISGYTLYVLSGLPSLNQLEHPRPEYSSKVYSADGELIGQYYTINRSKVSLDELPSYLRQAVVASEDRKFYRHRGIDPDRILKATVKNILSLRIREGASTITQQVARNLYLNQDQSITRKLREVITALQIEKRFPKDEILEMYMNLAYFGNNTYGIGAAAEFYFDKKVRSLTLTESALLVGLLPNPSFYDPFRSPERSTARRNVVLHTMYEMEYISGDVKVAATAQPLTIRESIPAHHARIASHFVEHVRRELLDLSVRFGFDIYRDGLSVYTTLDGRMQRHANRAVKEHIPLLQRSFERNWNWKIERNQSILQTGLEREIRHHARYRNAESDDERDEVRRGLLRDGAFTADVKKRLQTVQSGFVAIDPKSGAIRAMVGGSDFENNRYGLNRVTQSKRQPGSAFKPFVYTVAVDNGYAPSYELPNETVVIRTGNGESWSPANVDGSSGGSLSLREGLKWSVNLIAVRTMMELAPVEQVISYAHRMGILSDIPPYASISLGTGEVSPLELTAAYGTLANGGNHTTPYSIERVIDSDGKVLYRHEQATKRVLSAETAYIVTDMLRDVVEGGTGQAVRIYFPHPAAGKTGTTQDYADGWFIGYTPDLVAGSWVGFDDRRISLPDGDGQGAKSALPIWSRFMHYCYGDLSLSLQPREFNMPQGITGVTICTESHMLATNHCPETIDEIFASDKVPGECTLHQSFFKSVRSFISRIFK